MAQKSKKIKLMNVEKLSQINPQSLQLWRKYKVDMSLRELSPKTIAGYQNDIENWFIYILDYQNNRCITELTDEDITEFLVFCKENGNNTRRLKRRMSSISSFYLYLRKKKLITENPMEYIDRPKRDTDVVTQTFLTTSQIEQMKLALQQNVDSSRTLQQRHNGMMLQLYALLSLSTMARVNAISSLIWDKFDFDERSIIGILEKEQKIVDLFYSKECAVFIEALICFRKANNIDDGGYVFCSKYGSDISPISTTTLNNWCKKIGELIGVPTLHPHDFRHSGATLLKNAGMPLEDVSSLLNHEGTEVTQKFYIKADDRKIRQSKDKFEV